MKKDSAIDYLSCILFRLFGPVIRSLPKSFTFFLGERLGEMFYCLDPKHRAIAYSNIKTAFSTELSPGQIHSLTKEFYRSFGKNLIEIFFIPQVDEEYVKKYIVFEGLQHISEGFKRGKGVILLAVHEGSWELSNALSSFLRLPFSLFVRSQKLPRLNALLNLYRSQKGCKIIQRENEVRQLIKELKDNSAVGMTADQGGREGTLVKFFGKDASMPTGAIRMALKYDAAIIPVFYTRVNGPHIKAIIEPSFELKRTGDTDTDVRENLQGIIHVFEKYIQMFPHEYLWSYKIWKYTKDNSILVLSDAKAGHLRQSEAVARRVQDALRDKNKSSTINTVEVKFKNKFSKPALSFCSCLSGKYSCQGCLFCLKAFLKGDTYKALIGLAPDIIISGGSSLAPVNLVLAKENLAKSIAIMRPSILSTRRFDLVVMPRHDRPPRRKNVVITEGALNLIDEDYLKEESDRLLGLSAIRRSPSSLYIGLLIGGDMKNFHLDKDAVSQVIKQVKAACEKWDAHVLVTTSRRTPQEITGLVKEEFKDYLRCGLLVIANEGNIPQAVGGILGLSSLVITTPESISMISEAASSNKYTVTFWAEGLSRRHRSFLDYLDKNRYIYLSQADNLSSMIDDIWLKRPKVNSLKDNLLVSEAINKIL